MKKLIIAACVALAGCNLGAVPASPGQVADKVVLDEQAASGVELAYKAVRLAAELAVDSGKLKGANATRVAALDNQAFAAVAAVRTAYRTGNATSYAAAVTEARTLIGEMLAIIL